MKCPNCQSENMEGAKFCSECGTELQQLCPQCGAEVGPGAKFCSDCGAALGKSEAGGTKGPAATPPSGDLHEPRAYTPAHLAERILRDRSTLLGESRIVTVFFCDVADSTALAEELGPEGMHRFLNGFFELALEEVHRFEGTVNQFLGDGFMALFGAPLALEGHARRAVSVALGIQRAMAQGKLKGGGNGSPLSPSLRMGLNTGTVVVGAIGDNLRMDYTAVGDVTHLAARMQQAADPGTVYLSENTYGQVKDYFACESVGALNFKGIAKPVAAWKVLAEKAVRTPFEASTERGLTPFVGRADELGVLNDFLHRAQREQGQVVFLMGEAGMGKSRLLLEFRRSLPEGTVNWLEGQCMSFGSSIPYLPLIELLKEAFRIEEGDPESAIIEKVERKTASWEDEPRRTVPYLKWLLSVDPGDPNLAGMDPMVRRAGIYDGLRALLREESRKSTVVAVVEDLHWIDESSRAALAAAVEGIESAPVLMVLTSRPGHTHLLGEHTWFNRLALGQLPAEESLTVAHEVLQAEHLPEEVQGLIARKAGGNPFYIEEITRSLVESGALRRQNGDYILKGTLDEIRVPDTIQEVILSRIDRLDRKAREALQLASVIGREFTVRILERITELRSGASEMVEELKSLELIYQKAWFPELSYMFKHALIHDVAYSTLLEERRKVLHRIVGRAMEELYAERLNEHYEALAHHFDKAEDWAKAVEYLLKAAGKAAEAYASEEAMRYYERALERLEKTELSESEQNYKIEAQKGLAEVRRTVGDAKGAETAARSAIALGREIGLEPERLARLLYLLEHSLILQGRYDETLAVGEEALSLLEGREDPVERAVALTLLAHIYHFKGNRKKEEALRSEIRDLLAGAPYDRELSLSYVNNSELRAKRLERAVHALKSLEELGKRHGDLRLLVQTYGFGAWFVYAARGDFGPAIPLSDQAMEIARRIGDRLWETWCLYLPAMTVYYPKGELETAERLSREALELAEDSGIKRSVAYAHRNLSLIALAGKRWDEAIAFSRTAVGLFREFNSPSMERIQLLCTAQAHLARGEPMDARREFQISLRLAAPVIEDLSRPPLGTTLAGLEEAFSSRKTFIQFCREFREDQLAAKSEEERSGREFSHLRQWYLEPGEPVRFARQAEREDFKGEPARSWAWHDPFGDCAWCFDRGLEIRATNARDLWYVNLGAPRFLRPVECDFAAQTVSVPAREDRPAIGGLLLWKDEENYLRIDRGIRGRFEVSLEGCIATEDQVIGRGRLESDRMFLRLERTGRQVNALCSADGEAWFTVGQIEFPVDDPIEVGLHAIGQIDRMIYHGGFTEGTAIRFGSFELWE